MQIVQLGLRVAQFVLVLLVLALVGNAIDDAFAGNPSSVNWAMAVAVFTAVAWIYGMAMVFVESLPSIVAVILDGIASLFSLIAGIVLAAKLGVHSCSNQSYLRSNHLTNGSHNMRKRCHELQASTAFFWFLFPLFAATAALAAMSGGVSMKRGGAARRGGPSMSQV